MMHNKFDVSDDCANCLDYIYDELKKVQIEADSCDVVMWSDIAHLFKNLKKTGSSDGKQSKEFCLYSRVCRFVSDPDCVECLSFIKKGD